MICSSQMTESASWLHPSGLRKSDWSQVTWTVISAVCLHLLSVLRRAPEPGSVSGTSEEGWNKPIPMQAVAKGLSLFLSCRAAALLGTGTFQTGATLLLLSGDILPQSITLQHYQYWKETRTKSKNLSCYSGLPSFSLPTSFPHPLLKCMMIEQAELVLF